MAKRTPLNKSFQNMMLRSKHKIALMRAGKRPVVSGEIRGTFMIARVMGNDLYPRHTEGQMLRNLKFILENEPKFPGVTKLFVLNHLFDPNQLRKALSLIVEHGAEALIQHFVPQEYAALGWDIEPFGSADYFTSPEFLRQPKDSQLRMKIWACGPKLRYAMDVNGARNAAIRAGRARAEWTAVLDGNCAFTQSDFDLFREQCLRGPFTPYMIVPMHRLERNADFGKVRPDPGITEEPQIAFHCTSRSNFDERFPYGFRDKTVLLKNLGVPGPWQYWPRPRWMPEGYQPTDERYQYRYSKGAVFRLSSGGNGLERNDAQKKRYESRNIAILTTIAQLNEVYGTVAPEISNVITDIPGAAPAARKTMTQLINWPGTEKRLHFDLNATPDIARLNGRTLFIGLGAMKAGTTWVSDFLGQHPQVYHSQIKEMNFWNKLDPNPLEDFGQRFRMLRMKQILLERGTSYPPSIQHWETLQTLAELDDLETTKDYENYFARRVGDETHFGEICPQYSLMPPETYRRIADLGYDTRLMFFMRDPTERLASNIQHVLRRTTFDVDEIIRDLTENDHMYQRSDYTLTMDAYRQSGVDIPMKTFIYEDLFKDETLHELCAFLGIEHHPADFEKRVNASRGPKVTSAQKEKLREKLDPLYVKLATYLDEKPDSWRW